MRRIAQDPLDRTRFPIDEWALVETQFGKDDLGQTETLFAVGNGYLGLRGNYEEAREGHMYGTFVNGFHETWPIHHAEDAFGFAHLGQTIINVPDAKVIRLYVNDEPLILSNSDIAKYERRIDFATGVLTRDIEWHTLSGRHVRIRSRRLASFTDRHVALFDYEVTLLNGDASIVLSSQLVNRQDSVDEFGVGEGADGASFDPRKAESFVGRVLQPRARRGDDDRLVLGYRATNSRMTIAVAADHVLATGNEYVQSYDVEDDLAKQEYRIDAKAGIPVRLSKVVAYHTATSVPVRELVDRCDRTLDRIREHGVDGVIDDQREWLADFWRRSDVEIVGQPAVQQAVRWNLFQLAQASARAEDHGIPAKGVTGSGYGGHYFWDMEIYVLPFLSYTAPQLARNALRFRYRMLDAARQRAGELSQRGALFPWRTINGQEASAYYAAGTAQYHIDADIAYALGQYLRATGDLDFLVREGIDIFVETARMWEDLGFWRSNGEDVFHIHGVTGPDEYTTVVNDNLYTNVMARWNLLAAARAVEQVHQLDQAAYERMLVRLQLSEDEVSEWRRAARQMHIPFDEQLGMHPQDAAFLEKELWDVPNTPSEKFPLLLHYHPLVIYRFQVLKQADVVLALLLQGDQFAPEEKLADFDYYDPLTTGDSTLSAVAQSIMAAEVGYSRLALEYFISAVFVDLGDLHKNAIDGVHVASAGGVWSSLVYGFGGLRDSSGSITFDPRLPAEWETLRFRVTVHGSLAVVTVSQSELRCSLVYGDGFNFMVRGQQLTVSPSVSEITVPLTHQGARRTTVPSLAQLGGRRIDGTLITASLPTYSGEPADAGVDLEPNEG